MWSRELKPVSEDVMCMRMFFFVSRRVTCVACAAQGVDVAECGEELDGCGGGEAARRGTCEVRSGLLLWVAERCVD